MAWTKAHLHAKCHLDPSSHLATIDMGRKFGRGTFLGGARRWVPYNTLIVVWAEVYLHTKLHLDPSNRWPQ